MNKLKLTALLLALLMLISVFASCADETAVDGDSSDTSDTQAQENNGDENGEDPNAKEITVADAKGSAGLTGDFKAAFAAETDGENVITGPAQNSVPYSIWAAFSVPTKVTSVALTAPSKDMKDMASATIDGSVDGETWTELKAIGSSITKDKVYNLSVKDETQYLYIRVRQSDEHRSEAFRFRSMVVKGVEGTGDGGDLSKISEEVSPATLLAMNNLIGSNAGTGTQSDVFLDNENSWTASAQTNANFLIATMAKTTVIYTVKVKVWDSNKTMTGAKLQASVDGQIWTDLYTIPDIGDAETAEYIWQINDPIAYSYIKIAQADDNVTDAMTLNTVLFYGVATETETERIPEKYVAASTLKVNYDASKTNTKPHSDDQPDPSVIWDLSDKSTKYTTVAQGTNPEGGVQRWYFAGAFENDTVITQINYYSPATNGNRVRTSYFEASVDGETWVKIATLPGQNDLYTATNVITLTVDDDTNYRYIRLMHAENFYQYNLSLGTIEVIGVQYDADGNLIQSAAPTGPVIDPDDAVVVGVTHVASAQTKYSGSAEASLWDTSDKTTSTNYKNNMLNWVSGSFANDTVVTKIVYTTNNIYYNNDASPRDDANRARESYFELSVDGITWVRVGTLPNPMTHDQSYEITVTNTNAFKYIRLSQGSIGGWWTIGVVEVFGVEITE